MEEEPKAISLSTVTAARPDAECEKRTQKHKQSENKNDNEKKNKNRERSVQKPWSDATERIASMSAQSRLSLQRTQQ
eukprot:2938114-Rhodomonas_salina.1